MIDLCWPAAQIAPNSQGVLSWGITLLAIGVAQLEWQNHALPGSNLLLCREALKPLALTHCVLLCRMRRTARAC